jgi:hypothetical protein
VTLEKDIVLESEDRSGYIVWMLSRFRRLRDVETERQPSGVFVPGFSTCSDGKGV